MTATWLRHVARHPLRAARVNARALWRWHTKCRALGVGEPEHPDARGVPALFCDRWRGHQGDHRDRDRRLDWGDARAL